MKRKRTSGSYRASSSRTPTYGQTTTTSNSLVLARRAYHMTRKPELKYFDEVSVPGGGTGPSSWLTEVLSTGYGPFMVFGGGLSQARTGSGGAVGIALGAGETKRLTRSICYKSILLRGEIFSGNMASGQVDDEVRLLLVWDRNPNSPSALPDISAILQNDVIGVINAPLNVDNRKRFKVVFDRWYRVSANTANPMSIHKIREFIRLPYKSEYSTDTANTYAAISSGALLCYLVSGKGSAGTAPCFNLSFRARFRDC